MSSIRDRLTSSPEPEDSAPGFAEHDTRSAGGSGAAESEPVAVSHHGANDDTKLAELAVSGLFLLAAVGAVGFIATYVAWPFKYGESGYQYYTPLLGITMTLALVGVGAGAVLWAKTLMVDEETVQERHHLNSDPEDRAGAAAVLKQGAEESGLMKHPILRRSFLLSQAALAILPIPLLFGLGHFQHKERALAKTGWKKGSRLLDELGRPVKIGDLDVGGVKSVFPDVPGGRRMADSAALLIRMRPDQLKTTKNRENWVYEGHIVYSVICTHLGCPVKLYEQQTHHLFCPCHQSTFDAANGAKVLFGPAARNLPQLAITVDADGYFVARDDFYEPVGPSYWERKPSYKEPTYDGTAL
ncbi:MAG: Rieske (2Fe-2S) iron-sulfur domain protein [Frankiales bacterium]|nr:Rieske (2Fe-2S) iron-sulfur domain protein [Frankiales bacterium]